MAHTQESARGCEARNDSADLREHQQAPAPWSAEDGRQQAASTAAIPPPWHRRPAALSGPICRDCLQLPATCTYDDAYCAFLRGADMLPVPAEPREEEQTGKREEGLQSNVGWPSIGIGISLFSSPPFARLARLGSPVHVTLAEAPPKCIPLIHNTYQIG